MKKTILIAGLLACIVALTGSYVLGVKTDEQKDVSMYDLVSKDFFAGLSGDKSALERALKTCEGILAKEPNNAAAIAWQGGGWVCLSGFSFSAGDNRTGVDLWRRGFARLDQAAALAPTDIEVLITRGMAYAQCGLHSPHSTSANNYIEKGVKDLSSALDKIGREFATWPTDSRGQMLTTLADGLQRLGRTDEACIYYKRIATELPGTSYAEAANKQLQR